MKLNLLSIFSFFIFVSGCSVYKSAMRRDFEDKVPTSTLHASSLAAAKGSQCSTYDPLTAWMLRQFPTTPVELVSSEQGFEVWKQVHSDGQTTFKSYSTTPSGVEVCVMNESSAASTAEPSSL